MENYVVSSTVNKNKKSRKFAPKVGSLLSGPSRTATTTVKVVPATVPATSQTPASDHEQDIPTDILPTENSLDDVNDTRSQHPDAHAINVHFGTSSSSSSAANAVAAPSSGSAASAPVLEIITLSSILAARSASRSSDTEETVIRAPVKRRRKNASKVIDEEGDDLLENLNAKPSKGKGKAKDKEQKHDILNDGPVTMASLCSSKLGRKPRKSKKSISETADVTDIEESQDAATQQSAAKYTGPQVRVVNGQIVLDQATLAVSATPTETDIAAMEIVEEDPTARYITSATYMKLDRGSRWTVDETDKFFRALSQWGTDFEMIAIRVFGKKRTRGQIKKKFQREEKLQRARLELALRTKIAKDPAPVDEPAEENEDETAENITGAIIPGEIVASFNENGEIDEGDYVDPGFPDLPPLLPSM